MAVRTAIIATAFLGTIATLYHLTSSQTSIMSSTNRPQLSAQDVSVELSSTAAPLTVQVTIRNYSPDQTFSFLTWDSPFDPQAINTGVLSVKDAQTGVELEGPGMKLNRQLPPPREELIEVKPGSSATRELGLASPWVPTDGKKYQLQMRGNWRGAWAKAASEVTDGELEAMGSDQLSSNAFESDLVEMHMQQ